MKLKFHVGPDSSFSELKPFLEGGQSELVSAIYQFFADHVRAAPVEPLGRPACRMTLVADPKTRDQNEPTPDRQFSRAAWRLGYRSQRVAHRDRPFDKLFRLQRKLGSDAGWEAGLRRPKGMWKRTFEAHFDRYLELDARYGVEMMVMMSRLR